MKWRERTGGTERKKVGKKWAFWIGIAIWAAWGNPKPAWPERKAEMTRLIDSPTAGLIRKGRFGFDLRFFAEGGLLGRLDAGALDRLTIGISYGGEQIIGDRDVDWYPRVEASARYRIVEESKRWPAVVVGYETQGYGARAAGRYRIKSKGIFLALSRNYTSAMGRIGVHCGVNMTREDDDGDDDISGWIGMDKQLNEEMVLLGEYDLGLNDDGKRSWGSGKGYLNAGVRWAVAPHLEIGLYLKNLLENGTDDPRIGRELSVLYFEEF